MEHGYLGRSFALLYCPESFMGAFWKAKDATLLYAEGSASMAQSDACLTDDQEVMGLNASGLNNILS